MATNNSKLIELLVAEMNPPAEQVAENVHFDKGYQDGLTMSHDKLKSLHQKAGEVAKKHFSKYAEYDQEQVRDTPGAAEKRLRHGTAHHEVSSIRDGLAKAAKERGLIKEERELEYFVENTPTQTERDQLAALLSGRTFTPNIGAQLLCEDEKSSYVLHKAHGNTTLVSTGKKVGDMVGHISVIPDVDMSTLEGPKDQVKSVDKYHAYGHGRYTTKKGFLKFTKQRLGKFDSHDDALSAIKRHTEKKAKA